MKKLEKIVLSDFEELSIPELRMVKGGSDGDYYSAGCTGTQTECEQSNCHLDKYVGHCVWDPKGSSCYCVGI